MATGAKPDYFEVRFFIEGLAHPLVEHVEPELAAPMIQGAAERHSDWNITPDQGRGATYVLLTAFHLDLLEAAEQFMVATPESSMWVVRASSVLAVEVIDPQRGQDPLPLPPIGFRKR